MAFFDDLSKTVSKLGQDVSQKTQNLTDGVKLNSQISDQRKSLARLYEDLGRAAIKEESLRSNADCAKFIGMIEEGEAKLKDLERQLSINKGEIQCKNCQTFVPAGTAFCQNCGTKVEVPVQEQAVNQAPAFCTNCGKPLEQGAGFCTNCGTPVKK